MKRLVPLLVNLLKEWTKHFPHDFREDKMKSRLTTIIHNSGILDESVSDNFMSREKACNNSY